MGKNKQGVECETAARFPERRFVFPCCARLGELEFPLVGVVGDVLWQAGIAVDRLSLALGNALLASVEEGGALESLAKRQRRVVRRRAAMSTLSVCRNWLPA